MYSLYRLIQLIDVSWIEDEGIEFSGVSEGCMGGGEREKGGGRDRGREGERERGSGG